MSKSKKHWNTELVSGARFGSVVSLQVALDHGANVNHIAIDGEHDYAAIHWVASKGDVEAIEYLAGAGANMELWSLSHHTPLHLALQERKLPAFRALVAAGANINAENPAGGMTPLVLAIQRNQRMRAQALTEEGADLYYADEEGVESTLFTYAMEIDRPEIASMIKAFQTKEERRAIEGEKRKPVSRSKRVKL